MANKKIIIGISGGPASGKSTVATEFVRLGCAVIDADQIAHKLLEENDEVKKQLKEAFGPEVFDRRGRINRDKLSTRVFEDEKNVAKINSIIHPPVLARCEELIADYNTRSEIKAIVLDIPLLAEVGWAKKCDKLVFVDCSEEIRGLRAGQKGLFFKNQQKKREKFQISLDKKEKTADYIIQNHSDLSVLADEVFRIFSIIVNNI